MKGTQAKVEAAWARVVEAGEEPTAGRVAEVAGVTPAVVRHWTERMGLTLVRGPHYRGGRARDEGLEARARVLVAALTAEMGRAPSASELARRMGVCRERGRQLGEMFGLGLSNKRKERHET